MTSSVAPYLRGCLYHSIKGVPYPRADPKRQPTLPDDTWEASTTPASVRLEFCGTAARIRLEFELNPQSNFSQNWPGGTLFEVWRGTDRVSFAPASVTGTMELELGDGADPAVVYLPERMQPRLLSLEPIGGEIAPAPRGPAWLCYGDSIVEGWLATSPALTWPARVARERGLDLFNLGYAGCARGETATAEMIADATAELVTVAYGTNCWQRTPFTPEELGNSLEAFVARVRNGHPNVPIVVVSPILRPDAEHNRNRRGASLEDLRLAMETRTSLLIGSDPSLHLVRGRELLEASDLVDGIHPSDQGHERLGAAILEVLTEFVQTAEAHP